VFRSPIWHRHGRLGHVISARTCTSSVHSVFAARTVELRRDAAGDDTQPEGTRFESGRVWRVSNESRESHACETVKCGVLSVGNAKVASPMPSPTRARRFGVEWTRRLLDVSTRDIGTRLPGRTSLFATRCCVKPERKTSTNDNCHYRSTVIGGRVLSLGSSAKSRAVRTASKRDSARRALLT
jgi:hypothetical protein